MGGSVFYNILILGILLISFGCNGENTRDLNSRDTSQIADDIKRSDGNALLGAVVELKLSDVESECLDLVYSTSNNIGQPRIAEFWLSKSDNLDIKGATTGIATEGSQKQLIIQQPKSNLVRLVILATDNTNPIQSGTLATLKFKKTDDKPARVEILTDKPIFAPAEANEGLVVGDPLEF